MKKNNELVDLVRELLDYFEMDSGDWPAISIWTYGEVQTGVVGDELHSILIALQEAVEEEE